MPRLLPHSQPSAEVDLALILATLQKWLFRESQLGQISSLKGQISLVATTLTCQFIPCWSLYLFQVKVTLASVSKPFDLIQLSLLVIFEKSSHSFGSGSWIALSEHSSSRVYHYCPDMTLRKSPGNIGTTGHGITTTLEVGRLSRLRFPFGGPLQGTRHMQMALLCSD